MSRELEYELAREFGLTPRLRVVVLYKKGSALGEMEVERFDPKPLPPGTKLIPRFAFGRWKLTSAHRAIIRKIVEDVRRTTIDGDHCLLIEVEGHEDEVGDPAAFGKVGLERAKVVKEELRKQIDALGLPGVARSVPSVADIVDILIVVSSNGPYRPIRSNVTEDGRDLNRRVEVHMKLLPAKKCADMVRAAG
jgi:hypothetical protein